MIVQASADQVANAAAVQAGHPQSPAGLAILDGVGPISPTLLGYLACSATFTRVLLAPSGEVLDLGRTVRDATPAQRKALAARDRGCIIPGCDQPAGACIPHHVSQWQHGGTTAMINLALVCPRHHRDTHLGIWRILVIDGLPHAIAPPWLDPDQQPRRNTLHNISDHARTIGDQLRLTLHPNEDSGLTEPDPAAPDAPAAGPAEPDSPAAGETAA